MSSTQERAQLDIIIVGGGICGLACAIALKHFGVEAHVYEAATKFGEIGAAVGVAQNAIRVLREIGVLDTLLQKARVPSHAAHTTMMFYSGEEGELIYDQPSGPSEGGLGVTRTTLLDALVEHLDPKFAHFNKRCISVTQPTPSSPRPVVHFADGSSVEGDVILLANGIRGTGREVVTGTDAKNNVAFANTVCYRALAPAEPAKKAGLNPAILTRPACFMGTGQHAVFVPVAGGSIINISAFVIDHSIAIGEVKLADDQPRVAEATKAELLGQFEGWGHDALSIFGSVETSSKWSVEVVYPPLETYVKGRVALVGDAAHAMAPHLGAGAGQGIEDAYLLAQLLSDPQTTVANIEAVLKVYDAVRRPRAQAVWEATDRAGRIYEGYGPSGKSAEDRRRDIEGMWDFIWHHGVNSDRDSALQLLREQGVFQ